MLPTRWLRAGMPSYILIPKGTKAMNVNPILILKGFSFLDFNYSQIAFGLSYFSREVLQPLYIYIYIIRRHHRLIEDISE